MKLTFIWTCLTAHWHSLILISHFVLLLVWTFGTFIESCICNRLSLFLCFLISLQVRLLEQKRITLHTLNSERWTQIVSESPISMRSMQTTNLPDGTTLNFIFWCQRKHITGWRSLLWRHYSNIAAALDIISVQSISFTARKLYHKKVTL